MNGSVYSSSSLVVPDNQWTFVALTLTPSQAVLYMATNATVSSYSISRTDPADPVFTGEGYIGYAPYGDKYFKGTMDDVAMYGTALSAAQIAQLAHAALVQTPAVALTSPTNGATLTRAYRSTWARPWSPRMRAEPAIQSNRRVTNTEPQNVEVIPVPLRLPVSFRDDSATRMQKDSLWLVPQFLAGPSGSATR